VTDNLYDLSDCLFQLRRWFVKRAQSGVSLDPKQVKDLDQLLLAFGQAALKQAHEISRHR
jgi:hypothetical protein